MVEKLLIGIIILVIINIAILLKKKISVDIKSQLIETENAISKFDISLEHIEKSIKDEFQRSRQEINETSLTNRDELKKSFDIFRDQFSKNIKELSESLDMKFSKQNVQQDDFNNKTNLSAKENREELSNSLKSFELNFSENITKLNDLLKEKFGDFNKQQREINKTTTENVKGVENTIEKQLKAIREDNNIQLNEMRKTVDIKLQDTLEKRLGESFKQVSENLERVHKGLGEMQTIATGVGDLKKVLSNVKTRGILGEYQLENILEQLLTVSQYAKGVATKKGSQANVEFAVKLPGKNSDEEVWLPIDSKFPLEPYNILINALENGDKAEIELSEKALVNRIKSFAKDISEKYLDPPHTTNFGIMFLPIEGLYAEVLRHPGLFETLQNEYRITITGPTTLSALLNSLSMGFRTLAVQKRSSEVWKILESVKLEFGKFTDQIDKVDKHLSTASKSLYDLKSTRTNVLARKLETVTEISENDPDEVVKISEVY